MPASMRSRSARRVAASHGVADSFGDPSSSWIHGSSWAITPLASPAANSSWMRTTRSTARSG